MFSVSEMTMLLQMNSALNKFDALVNLPDDVDAAWAEVTNVYHSTATEIIGFRKFRKQLWLTDETPKCSKTKLRHARDKTRLNEDVYRVSSGP